MAVDADFANLLLMSDVKNSNDLEDSDDCSTADEDEIFQLGKRGEEGNVGANHQSVLQVNGTSGANDGKDHDDYHKMQEIEHRTYQVELLKLARERNVIICLPTGSGKTFIALKLMEEMLPQAIENGKKIVFLANNVPLVHQQARYFSANLVNTFLNDDNYVRAITGDLNVDFWKEEQWEEVMSSYHILVMSTQIFLDALTKAYVKWNQVALLILDECHHAQKDHPMAVLMRNYNDKREKGITELPKILGLTATIIKGNSKEHMIPRDIEDIETLLCSKAVTHRNYEEVLRYSTDSTLKTKTYVVDHLAVDPVCQDINKFMELLDMLPRNFASPEEVDLIESINHPDLTSEDQIYNKHKGVPKTLKANLNDLVKTYGELGPFCCKLAAVLKLVAIMQWIQGMDDQAFMSGEDEENSGSSQESDDTDEKEKVDVLTLLYAAKTAIIQFIKRLEDFMRRKVLTAKLTPESKEAEAFIIKTCVSNKISVLCDLLKSKRPTDDDEDSRICALIFCQRRITAQVLRWYLEKYAELCPDEMGFIKPELMVGHSTYVENTEVARFSAKRQTEIIRRFHARELNVLVATQVVEEGLNVPACNLVVRFDPITSYPSMVQSIGRARKRGAVCYAMIDISEREKEVTKIQNYTTYNKVLAKELEKNAIHVGEDDDDDRVSLTSAHLIPPFCPSGDSNGPTITETDAISLVHRHCNSLSYDRLGSLVPKAFSVQSKTVPPQFRAVVVLPVLSPVRDAVEGEWMPDKTLAKRSAYMEVCKKLYYAGALTENLLPKPVSIEDYKCEFLQSLRNEYEEEKATANGKVGTRKRVQWHPKRIPESIRSSRIRPSEPVSAYRIHIKVQYTSGDPKFSTLYDFNEFGLFYGIITPADLTRIPNFTLLAHYGTIEVSIKKCKLYGRSEVSFHKQEIDALVSFQKLLLHSAYGTRNPVLQVVDEPPLLVVPIVKDPANKTFVVHWKLVEELKNFEEDQVRAKPNEKTLESMHFDEDTYENTVVVPWYKDEDDMPELELLCTVMALSDSSATSQFDDPSKYPTFQQYFETKYGVTLFHPEFPLLQCKALGKQLNFLTKKVDGKQQRREFLRAGVKMIPELVNIYPLPGSLLTQGRFLPSILHRIYRLLLAEELQAAVGAYFNWDVKTRGEENNSFHNIKTEVSPRRESGPEIPPPLEKGSAQGKKKGVVLLETLNPLEIPWDLIMKSPKRRLRDSKFSLPEAPRFRSAVDELIPVDDVIFESFDNKTDFNVVKGPGMMAIMEALTLSNAQDSMDLETLEVIGDSFLKLIVSLHIYRNFQTWDEGKMTLLRMKLISNLHLYQHGKKRNIHELLSGSIFIPSKNWLPPGFTIPNHIEKFVLSNELDHDIFTKSPQSLVSLDDIEAVFTEDAVQNYKTKCRSNPHTSFTHSRVADKSVADAVEALIGAYYMSAGIDGGLRCMEWLGLRGPLMDGSCTPFSRESCLSPPDRTIKDGPQNIIPLLKDLEDVIGYKFNNPWLPVEALTHPTYMGNRQTCCYERLEFLGDAVLDFLVSDYILKNTSIKSPGDITDLRSALVNNVTFGSLAVRYGFHTFLKHSSETLTNYINKFVQHQESNNHEVSDPYELYSDFDCPTVREIEVPKVLGDIFESIVGAVLVDSGMKIDTVWRVVYRLMKKELETFSQKIPKSPIRYLYEYYPGKVKFCKLTDDAAKQSDGLKRKRTESKFQVVYLKISGFKTPILGIGSNVKQAKQAAAKYVIKQLKLNE